MGRRQAHGQASQAFLCRSG